MKHYWILLVIAGSLVGLAMDLVFESHQLLSANTYIGGLLGGFVAVLLYGRTMQTIMSWALGLLLVGAILRLWIDAQMLGAVALLASLAAFVALVYSWFVRKARAA